MKTSIIATLLATAAFSVAAGEIVAHDDHFVSTKTRAEVMAELAQSGGYPYTQGEIVAAPESAPSSTLTRAQVRAELARAMVAGELSAQNEITAEPSFARYGAAPQQLASGDAGKR